MPKTKDGGFFLDESSIDKPRYPLKKPKAQEADKKNTDGSGCKKPKGKNK